MIIMNIFQSIKRDKHKGHGIRQISRKLGVSRKTVAKYYHMSEDEYVAYQKTAYQKQQAFEPYKDEILEIYQRNENKVYASSVFDALEEKYGASNLPGTARTLRKYVSQLVRNGEILSGETTRIYTPVDQLPFGKQLQVDFGQVTIETGEEIYIFASVLSASRYRYVAVQNRPFTTIDVILHLIDCFNYIGGIPQ